jgi:hypothetical protein
MTNTVIAMHDKETSAACAGRLLTGAGLARQLRTARTLSARRLRAMTQTKKINIINNNPQVSRKPGQVQSAGSCFATAAVVRARYCFSAEQSLEGPLPHS